MENLKGSSDGEDIPSDFFDDFSKEEFMAGLSVVDSWDDKDKKARRTRTKAEELDQVEDLRDIISRDPKEKRKNPTYEGKNKSTRNEYQPHKRSFDQQRSDSSSRLDSYIKPGSRRDPNKTNQAIKKDKEEKVKEYLAKHLESSDDLRPPGTELDDFFEGKKDAPKLVFEKNDESPPQERVVTLTKIRDSPMKRKDSPRQRRHQWSPRRPYHSPRRSPKRSPRRSPRRSPPLRRSPPRRSPPRRSLPRRSPHRSPRHVGSNRNFRGNYKFINRRQSPGLRRRKSRSPIKHTYRRSRSRSPNNSNREYRRQSRSDSPDRRSKEFRQHSRSDSPDRRPKEDDFLYPKSFYPSVEFPSLKNDMQYATQPQYTEPMIVEYPLEVPSVPYTQGVAAAYSGYVPPYEYEVQPAPPMMHAPQPVPAPNLNPAAPGPLHMTPGMAPTMVPPPQQITPTFVTNRSITPQLTEAPKIPPEDALARLVADGKLSHEDYLKLAPNKGVVTNVMDTHAKVVVLNRCNSALSRLGNIVLPNRLLLNNNMITAGPKQKPTVSKYCSPLKRQPAVEFHFTKVDTLKITQQNKQIVESLITTLSLDSVVGKPRKKVQKDMKDASVQTVKPFCDVCEVRESMQFSDTGTSSDPEVISSSVHTQVIEQDLVSSKAVFNPSGSISDGAPISIAHMTPAQLVSQLAARAKTLKQTDPPQSSNQFRTPHGGYYDDRGRGNQYQGNNFGSNNYRY